MLINKLLSGAVKLWLKSQVSEVKNLKINIIGNSKQILTGEIPEVDICADDVVYQGLHLSKLNVKSTKIKFDLSSILNKKQFELSEAVIIDITVFSLAKDLQNSLSSLLVNSGLTDVWHRFLIAEGGHPQAPHRSAFPSAENPHGVAAPFQGGERMISNSIDIPEQSNSYCWNYLSLFQEGIEFKGVGQKSGKNSSLIRIKTNIKSIDEHSLLLTPIEIEHTSKFYPKNFLPITFDLGKQVSINQLEIVKEHLFLQGQITIYP